MSNLNYFPRVNGPLPPLNPGAQQYYEGIYKLHVIAEGELSFRVAHSIRNLTTSRLWATLDRFQQVLLTNAVAAVHNFSLLARTGNELDGAIIIDPPGELDDFIDPRLAKHIDMELMKQIVAVICATKVNFFLENNHVGQGRGNTYPERVIISYYSPANFILGREIINIVAQWASTRKILSTLGIRNIIQVQPIFLGTGVYQRNPQMNAMLSSNPAGTAKHFIAYKLFKKMLSSIAISVCPNITNFAILPVVILDILRNPAVYHTQARYLTGQIRDFDDADANAFLGRVGTYGRVFYPNSVIMTSPYLANEAYKNYDDYSEDFEQELNRIRLNFIQEPHSFIISDRTYTTSIEYYSLAESFEVENLGRMITMLDAINDAAEEGIAEVLIEGFVENNDERPQPQD